MSFVLCPLTWWTLQVYYSWSDISVWSCLTAFTSPHLSLVLLIPGVSVNSSSWIPGWTESLRPLLEVTSPFVFCPRTDALAFNFPAACRIFLKGYGNIWPPFMPCRKSEYWKIHSTLMHLELWWLSRALNRIFVSLLFVSKISYTNYQLQEKWASLLIVLCRKPSFMTELHASGVLLS